MGLWHNLRCFITAGRTADPDFGDLRFVRDLETPQRSHWAGEWGFPATGTVIEIRLRCGPEGPSPQTREFIRSLSRRYECLLDAARPVLERAVRVGLMREPPADILTAVRLTGLLVDASGWEPVRWEMDFETTDTRYFAADIIVPFVDDTPQEPLVHTM